MTSGPYTLIDSGHGRKLEAFGDVIVERQAPSAVWSPRRDQDQWRRARGVHHRKKTGGGQWEWRGQEPSEWIISHGGLDLTVKPTPFGHMGLFAEQAAAWDWLRGAVPSLSMHLGRAPKIINLFAYTGGSTLALAQSGAEVTHVDAAKGVVTWARENARINDLDDRPVRWIVEDCQKFLDREIKRGRRYDGVVLDPPSYGRGTRGEVFRIEDGMDALLRSVSAVCNDAPKLTLFSSHTPGFTPLVLENLSAERFAAPPSLLDSGEMTISEKTGRLLPSGAFARFCVEG